MGALKAGPCPVGRHDRRLCGDIMSMRCAARFVVAPTRPRLAQPHARPRAGPYEGPRQWTRTRSATCRARTSYGGFWPVRRMKTSSAFTCAAFASKDSEGYKCAAFAPAFTSAWTRHEHDFHCRGSGAASCWIYRCRESPATLPGVLEPRQAAWLRFLTLRPAICGWRGQRPVGQAGRHGLRVGQDGQGVVPEADGSSNGCPRRYVARTGRGGAWPMSPRCF